MSPSSLADLAAPPAPRDPRDSGIRATPVPCLWPGGTVVCIATGLSLTQFDVDAVQGQFPVIVVNDAWLRAPWADLLYAADASWWETHQAVDDYLPRRRYSASPEALPHCSNIHLVHPRGKDGLHLSPDSVATGGHSGYQAINIAVHAVGPGGRILLLGYDMRPNPASLLKADYYVGRYHTMLPVLRDLNITVINCSRQTAITAFPRQPLAEILTASFVNR